MERIGYILLEYPRYSETFVLNELRALGTHGLPHHLFCLQGDEAEIRTAGRELACSIEVVGHQNHDEMRSLTDPVLARGLNADALEKLLARAFNKYMENRERVEESKRLEPLRRLACAVRIAAACLANDVSHLHAHYANSCAEVALMVKRLAAISYSFTGHAKDVFTMRPERLRPVIECASFVLGCSRAGVDFMKRHAGSKADSIHLVYHGIKMDRWNPAGKDAHRGKTPGIVAVGRLTPKKGFVHLVEALGWLRKRGIEQRCTVIGDGRERDRLVERARACKVEHQFEMLGRLSQEAIQDHFAKAPIFVMPSIILEDNNQDGLANALLEAMACGLAVVATDIPAFREILQDEENALVVESGNSQALANALERLLESDSLRMRLGQNSRASVEKLTCEQAAIEIKSLFDRYVQP